MLYIPLYIQPCCDVQILMVTFVFSGLAFSLCIIYTVCFPHKNYLLSFLNIYEMHVFHEPDQNVIFFVSFFQQTQNE